MPFSSAARLILADDPYSVLAIYIFLNIFVSYIKKISLLLIVTAHEIHMKIP